MTVFTPITVAETISEWTDPDEVREEVPYVNALASDVLAKWANWCMTVRMPGESKNPQELLEKGPFKIHCNRDRYGTAPWAESQVGKWELPPLRFDESYEFLLRRVDFAGNHLYDELVPPRDIDEAALKKIESIVGQTPAARACLDPETLNDSRFVRAELPHMALLAFPVTRSRPEWHPKPRPDEVEPDYRDFQLVAFKREPVLVLFSDVFGRARLMDDSYGYLLPPAAPVETVLMHGVFDHSNPKSIPELIRCHERYMARGILGVDRQGWLNYFGDPQVKKLHFDFVFLQATVPANTTLGDRPAENHVFKQWPVPSPIYCRSSRRRRLLMTAVRRCRASRCG